MTYFLAGVGNAEILKNGNLFATAKTLTDSSITIGVSAEDIRAGRVYGAGLADEGYPPYLYVPRRGAQEHFLL